MTTAVLDASVILKWFRAAGEFHVDEARLLRARLLNGTLALVAPLLLQLELVNVAGRRWHRPESELLTLVRALGDLGFEFREPPLDGVAIWTARGLTAYDASYVALAEAQSVALVSDDELILRLAGSLAVALASAGALP